MSNIIPNSVIGAVASVLAAYYYSHSKLNTLFMGAGAPGDVPDGNCETKCSLWLKRCNEFPEIDPLIVLGRVIQDFMDKSLFDDDIIENKVTRGQARIIAALERNQLIERCHGTN
ncbi:hypothetical protein [Vibrio metschnikovii]|uniref:hypothetical protein n=1 Tax=Vibrio metschnikovii TaxID=28172 RepID=UPI002FC7D54B